MIRLQTKTENIILKMGNLFYEHSLLLINIIV
jgi:hypothetical protein